MPDSFASTSRVAALTLAVLALPLASAAEPPAGFVSLFNGRDLDGFRGAPAHGNPRAYVGKSAAEREELDRSTRAEFEKHWRVENGEIINDLGKGPYLATDRDYADYELLVDWKIGPGADSGLYLRSTPQVQIWDPVNGIEAAKVGSGGLYNNQRGPSKPLVNADRPAGEWNTFRILLIDDEVSIWLNEVPVVVETPLENYWDRKAPLDAAGPILFQTHDGELRFRNLFIREIPRRPPESGTLAFPKGSGRNPPASKGAPPGDGWVAPEGELGDFELHAWIERGAKGEGTLTVRGGGDGGVEIDLGAAHVGRARSRLSGQRSTLRPSAKPGTGAHLYAIARGERVAVWVDGVETAELYDRGGPVRGSISTQVEGDLRVSKLLVRPIGESFHLDYRGGENDEGFTPIFNGVDLTGWIGSVGGYSAENGKLVCRKDGGGNLYTEHPYDDFVLRFEVRLEDGGNNGVGIRSRYAPWRKAKQVFDAAYHGIEVQILENTAGMYRELEPYQYHGSVYGVVAAKRGFSRPVGYWNYEEIRAEGGHITVKLNGETIVDANIHEHASPALLKQKPGVFNQLGYIGFLGHGHRIELRNLRIHELTGN